MEALGWGVRGDRALRNCYFCVSVTHLLFQLLLKCYQNVNQCLYSLLSQVNPGSLAAKCGLQTGDIILKIGNADTSSLRHKEAQNSIIAAGNRLDLLLQRYLSLTYAPKRSCS